MNKPIILLNYKDRFTIGNEDFCIQSSRTFTISFNELALNRKMLDAFPLIHLRIKGDEEEIKWFGFYLSSFSIGNEEKYSRWLRTNPNLRVLIYDDELRERLKDEFKIVFDDVKPLFNDDIPEMLITYQGYHPVRLQLETKAQGKRWIAEYNQLNEKGLPIHMYSYASGATPEEARLLVYNKVKESVNTQPKNRP